jgi:hypothetical protein
VFTLYLLLARPDYLAPALHHLVGLGDPHRSGVILMVVGALWLSKTVKVEV